jgi:hypothetical protein
MHIIVLYRPGSEFARRAEDYIADFQRFHPGAQFDVLSIDSIEGSEKARLYGVMQHPAILAVKDDGQVQQQWEGIDKFPVMNDLAYYSYQ